MSIRISVRAARSFGGTRRDLFLKVALPGSVPILIAGLRIAVGRALTGVVAAELFGATAGLGFQHRLLRPKAEDQRDDGLAGAGRGPRRDLYPASLAPGIGDRFLANDPGPLKEPSWTRGCASSPVAARVSAARFASFRGEWHSRRRGRAGRAKCGGGRRRDRGGRAAKRRRSPPTSQIRARCATCSHASGKAMAVWIS